MNNQMYLGYVARKCFGQHFLTDQLIINDIVNFFNPKVNQSIVEIGPGFGALTVPVSNRIDHMTIIELDRNLAIYLSLHPMLLGKITVIQKDAMTFDFSKILKKNNKLIRIFGNLPYNISIPLIFHIFAYSDIIFDMNFMLQKEVVNRLIAKPNTKTYGRLSVMAQYYCKIIPILNIPPSAFTPVPKVESTVVRFIPHELNPYSICDVKLLRLITTRAFNQRRKTIRNSLGSLFKIEDFKQLDINLNNRAENISIENYCKLACKLSKIINGFR
ncbi:Ribosomal RNA small subunit methyltransferase A [Candidatus Arsenophonus lipoptenae]|uniref:Ribosomal RNA small subunit methyltransferase A n=1 Tax=Candidatus Arsenophonus lipoptenae TaxID=634113 RepID=A0A0X9VML5_9GAMM|nr:16S rRNA (adenine(1518)-N(6)/adenine(1519)-N(6))-dimethyltransferase RsmA [Candidatus Arsenophonus lipoptenae]AMA64971.1 Ribosomal RNA small subunit methyltransferase A [Candidatus Arsenophonus lipoptenae]